MSDQTRLPADPAQSLPAFGAPDTLSRAPGGRIVREKQPTNLEFPFSALAGPLMADDSLYVRSHFPEPAPDPQAWRLRVEGAVEQAAEWSLEELMALPAQSLKVTIECAGNGRVFLTPTASGVQWDLGGVGTAEWTGVPLSAVLERAGVREGALEVILEGADEGPVGVCTNVAGGSMPPKADSSTAVGCCEPLAAPSLAVTMPVTVCPASTHRSAGTVLLGRKFIENWPTWLIVNASSVGLFAYKGLNLTVVLYVIFFALAIWGWIGWQRRLTRPTLA